MALSANKRRIGQITALVLMTSAGFGLSGAWIKGLDDIPPGFRAVDLGDEAPLVIGEKEVTQREWRACVNDRACPDLMPMAQPGAQGDAPMTQVSVLDAEVFIAWKSKQDGITYRLPTHTEWLLASADLAPPAKKRRFSAPELSWAADFSSDPPDLRDLGANNLGLVGMRDAVWEWTMSCQTSDGRIGTDCYGARIAMGHHAAYLSVFTRDTTKTGCGGGSPPPSVGFRLVAAG